MTFSSSFYGVTLTEQATLLHQKLKTLAVRIFCGQVLKQVIIKLQAFCKHRKREALILLTSRCF